MSDLPSYRIVAGSGRNHSENVWGAQPQSGRAYLGMSPSPGQLIGRKNAINLAVWLLRAVGATQFEVNQAMVEAMGAPTAQGFRMQFGDDEP